MANKKYFQGKDTFHRVNFLYQAAEMCRQLPGFNGKKLMMIYGSHLTSVCRKTVSRLDVHMKRKICKGCCGILVPGDTALVRLTKKPESQILWICTMCGAYRLFNTRPGHRIWRDSPDAIIEKLDLNPEGVTASGSSESEHPPNDQRALTNKELKNAAPISTKGDLDTSCADAMDLDEPGKSNPDRRDNVG